MGRVPQQLKAIIAANIRACRLRKFPGRGGSKKCAEEFGVSPQQWSPWEKGKRTPDEFRMEKLAEFFGVTVEYLRTDHTQPQHQADPVSPQQPSIGIPPFPFPPLRPDPLFLRVEPIGALHELLECTNRLIWLVTVLQDDALVGKRDCKMISDLLQQTKYFLERRL